LLPNTAFIRLADLGMHLPEYHEERRPIPLDERLKPGLETLQDIYHNARKLAQAGMPGLLAGWLHASLAWVDCPVSETLIARDRDGNKLSEHPIEGIMPVDDTPLDPPLAKDQVLLDLITVELAKGRGVGIFFAQVNRRDWMDRIQKCLTRKGIYSEILRRSTCQPEDRETWYRGFVERCRAKGQEPVLLANGNLIREGLDLIELPTLIETGIEYRINYLRQRIRRSWRITQDKPVRIIFLYYEDSWQAAALQLVAAHFKAALLVDGVSVEGLAAMDDDAANSLFDELMRLVQMGRKQSEIEQDWGNMRLAA
jgi:hypothetical protein